MTLSGNGIYNAGMRILPGFKPDAKLALTWKQLSNGSYICVDRKQESDIYGCNLSLYGREKEIDGLIDAFERNRRFINEGANIFELSEFNAAEMIFGAEVDYSRPIRAMAAKIGEKEQKSWRGFSLKVTLRALDRLITRSDAQPVFPNINAPYANDTPNAFLAVGFTGDSVVDMQKGDTYTGVPNFSDMRGDSGYFEGTFTLKTNDMANLRTFLIHKNRGEIITAESQAWEIINDIPGVKNLFGVRRMGGKFNVRITEWTDLGMKGLSFWQIKMKFAEEV